VEFGLMICFDIMFEEPQKSLLEKNIQNFAYSSWWVNNINGAALITATQSQQSWSRINKVNLLASGIGLNYASSGR
jgi:predicted amidohydrolase